MKKILFSFALIYLFYAPQLLAQEETNFSVRIDRDSVLFGNAFKVTFALEGASASNFKVNGLEEEFVIVGGPNTSTSIQIINGDMQQQQSWSYYLQPKEEGIFYIPPASVKVEDAYLETQAIEIWVVPNPDGLIQGPTSGFRLLPEPEMPPPPPPPAKPKKKRKVTRI